jgi:ectoine hydroxylase-related dioxygenase (phytanoyl-CoA dioxygenase family)
LETRSQRFGWLTPTPADLPLAALKEQYQEQGYLWLKGLLDPAEVREFRGYVFRYLAQAGLILAGSDPRDGISAGSGFEKAEADRRLMALVRCAAYEAFCVQPRLWRLMDPFLGGLSYLHKRKLMRYTQPQTTAATPAHYDLIYLRGGTTRIVTAWIPIGDVPVAMGGLVYLEGSHRIGIEMEKEFSLKATDLTPEERINAYNKNMSEGGWISKDLPDMANRFNTRWLAADYEAGDVMLHSPYMIHASTTNEDAKGRIRLSTDIRYQNVQDEIDVRWNNHWSLSDML